METPADREVGEERQGDDIMFFIMMFAAFAEPVKPASATLEPPLT